MAGGTEKMRGIEPVVDKEERGIAVGKHSGKKFTLKERKLLTRKQLFLVGPYYLSIVFKNADKSGEV